MLEVLIVSSLEVDQFLCDLNSLFPHHESPNCQETTASRIIYCLFISSISQDYIGSRAAGVRSKKCMSLDSHPPMRCHQRPSQSREIIPYMACII